MANYAVISSGGKQYRVGVGDILQVEKLVGNKGDKLELQALCVFDDGAIKDGKKVSAEIVAQVKDKKIVVFKYKAKKNVRKKLGHRQPHTKIKILAI